MKERILKLWECPHLAFVRDGHLLNEQEAQNQKDELVLINDFRLAVEIGTPEHASGRMPSGLLPLTW
ncbi:MAG: hypothetical protein ACI97A_002064 [Planctomycetota bacterium]|jgi:hypothetical protein